MKVLHVVTLHTPDNAFGGPMRVATNLAGELGRRGVDASILTMGRGFGRGRPTDVDGVRAVVAPAYRLVPTLGVSGIVSPRALLQARGLVRSADLVHVHLARDLLTAPVAAFALRARTPLVVQTHGMVDPSPRRLAAAMDALVVRDVLRRASSVLYLTELERRLLVEVVGEPGPARLDRLANGVSEQVRRPHPGGQPLISYVARFQDRKRPADLVRAMPAILAAHPGARFVLAGPDEGRLADTLQLAGSLGVGEAVEYVGSLGHAAVLDLLRRSSVYVLPSVDEPFPMSVLEAMSLGVPAVVTTSNGLAADIREAGAGRVVAQGADIAAAVLDLLGHEANEVASIAAHRLATSRFALGAVVDSLQAVYQRAVASG